MKYTYTVIFEAENNEDAKSAVEDAVDTSCFESIHSDTLTDEAGEQV